MPPWARPVAALRAATGGPPALRSSLPSPSLPPPLPSSLVSVLLFLLSSASPCPALCLFSCSVVVPPLLSPSFGGSALVCSCRLCRPLGSLPGLGVGRTPVCRRHRAGYERLSGPGPPRYGAGPAAVARSLVAAWREACAGLIPAAYQADYTVPMRRGRWLRILRAPLPGGVTLVGEVDGVVEGFASIAVARDEDVVGAELAPPPCIRRDGERALGTPSTKQCSRSQRPPATPCRALGAREGEGLRRSERGRGGARAGTALPSQGPDAQAEARIQERDNADEDARRTGPRQKRRTRNRETEKGRKSSRSKQRRGGSRQRGTRGGGGATAEGSPAAGPATSARSADVGRAHCSQTYQPTSPAPLPARRSRREVARAPSSFEPGEGGVQQQGRDLTDVRRHRPEVEDDRRGKFRERSRHARSGATRRPARSSRSPRRRGGRAESIPG